MANTFQTVHTEDGTVIAYDPATGLSASGRSLDEAVAELRRMLAARNTRIALREVELQDALDAFEDWARCKRRADQTLSFADCHESAQAYVRFVNLYLGDKRALVKAPSNGATILAFGGAA